MNIKQRLRENADLDEMEHCNPIVIALEREAADEVERLEEEIAELETENAELQAEMLAPVASAEDVAKAMMLGGGIKTWLDNGQRKMTIIASDRLDLAEARNKALEEAAQLAYHYAYGIVLTDAIRALKTPISGEAD